MKREQEEEHRRKEKEDAERRRKNQEKKWIKHFLESSFDGEVDDLEKIMKQVLFLIFHFQIHSFKLLFTTKKKFKLFFLIRLKWRQEKV